MDSLSDTSTYIRVLYTVYIFLQTPHPKPSFRQPPHHALKRHERDRIRRKRPQKARHKTPPETPQPIPPPDCPGRILPPGKAPAAVAKEGAPQGIGHDALLDDVGRVGRHPEDLGRESAGEEVDGRSGEAGALREEVRE